MVFKNKVEMTNKYKEYFDAGGDRGMGLNCLVLKGFGNEKSEYESINKEDDRSFFRKMKMCRGQDWTRFLQSFLSKEVRPWWWN